MKANEKDKPWTRKELSLRIGFGELAKAVIEQWHKDGEPECDREAMQYWFNVYSQFSHRKDEVTQ